MSIKYIDNDGIERDVSSTGGKGSGSSIFSNIITTTEPIPENTDYEIPVPYIVGANDLEIYYMGEKLISGLHFTEVGEVGELSTTIQFKDWGESVPEGRTLEFIVLSVDVGPVNIDKDKLKQEIEEETNITEVLNTVKDLSTKESNLETRVKALEDKGGGVDINTVYPVGSIYISINSTDPKTLFGGTWTKISANYYLMASTSGGAGAVSGTGNSRTFSHSHTFNSAWDAHDGLGNGVAYTAGSYRWKTGGRPVNSESITLNVQPASIAVCMWYRTA